MADFDAMLARKPVAYARVLHDYKAANEDEISLREGEQVIVYSKDEEEVDDCGWFFGRIGTRYGVFPANFVVEEEELVNSTPAFPAGGGLLELPFAHIDLVQCIGSGGFGRVYLARYCRREVAAKVISTEGLSEQEVETKAQELRAEGELLSGCSHINICKLFGASTAAPNFCLIMEYARGGSLNHALKQVALPPKVIVDWATQIARGMNYLHYEASVSVVHRDLKSGNILLLLAGDGDSVLLHNNILKITDFGLARRHSETTHMSTAGTFAWMAPEVIRTSSFSKGSDVWSYGVLLWELLTSQIPYHGIHVMTIAYSVGLTGSTLPIPSNCPAPFGALMEACWDPECRNRPTFSDLLLTLQNARSAFEMTSSEGFGRLQEKWRGEMADTFKALVKSEQEISSQQAELERGQKQQDDLEQRLLAKERDLLRKERELQHREAVIALASDQGKAIPEPVKRMSRVPKWMRRAGHAKALKAGLTSADIGAPLDFQHLVHIGSDLPNTVPVSPPPATGVRSPPKTPPSPWTCKQCTFAENTPFSRVCAVCQRAITPEPPEPPPRDNPPSARNSLSQPENPFGTPLVTPVSTPKTPGRASIGSPVFQSPGFSHTASIDVATNPFAADFAAENRLRSPTSPSSPASAASVASPASGSSSGRRSFLRQIGRRLSLSGMSKLVDGMSLPPRTSNDRCRAASASCMLERPSRLPRFGKRRSTTTGCAISGPYNVKHTKHLTRDDKEMATSEMPVWLRPELTRVQATELLQSKPVGTFVIRASRSQLGQFAICVVHAEGQQWNGRLHRTDEGWRLGDESRVYFQTLTELVRHYQAIPYTVSANGARCTLREYPSEDCVLRKKESPLAFAAGRPRSRSESRINSTYSENETLPQWEEQMLSRTASAVTGECPVSPTSPMSPGKSPQRIQVRAYDDPS
eukprot:m.36260 g.36260  ORF g.36260 m.36260 type:complete len:926 (-) comp11002_c0_seq1:25-2802(-)